MHHIPCWLSVLIPAYNVQDFVAPCLESILTQILPGVEIVVVNDGSTDSTGRVVADMQRRHSAVLTACDHAVNHGIGTTRNHLVERARGEYLWFVDADDTMNMGAMASLQRIVAATDDTRYAELAADHRSMAGRAAAFSNDGLCEEHAVHVLGAGRGPRQHDRLACAGETFGLICILYDDAKTCSRTGSFSARKDSFLCGIDVFRQRRP